MSIKTSSSYLLQSQSNYIFRYCLPKDIRLVIGKRELRYSVRTGTLSLAKSRARYLAGQMQMIIRNLRQGGELAKLTKDKINELIGKCIRDFLKRDEERRYMSDKPLTEKQYEFWDKGYAAMVPDARKKLGMRKKLETPKDHLSFQMTYLKPFGYESEPNSSEYKALHWEVQKMHTMLAQVLSDRHRGIYGTEKELLENYPDEEQVKESLPLTPIEQPAPTGQSISQTLKEYKEEGFRSERWNEKTFSAIEGTVKLFINLSGDVPINSITTPDVSKFFKMLQKFPTNVSKLKKYNKKSIEQCIKIAARDNDNTLAVNSINDHMSRLSGIFTYAKIHGIYIGDNPTTGMRMTKKQRNDEARDIFDKEDLIKLFKSPEYTEDTHDKSFKFWAPILGLFTGARIDEICQLHLEDIRQEEGTWVLDLNSKDEKKLKNLTSKRLVPLHPFIIEDLNLIGHIETLKQQGHDRLFPDIERKRDGYGATVSRWFSRYKDACGIKAPPRMKTFHSFRHTFDTNLKYQNVNDVMSKELMGHAVEGMGATYQKRYPATQALKEGIMKLDYSIDLKHLKGSKYTG